MVFEVISVEQNQTLMKNVDSKTKAAFFTRKYYKDGALLPTWVTQEREEEGEKRPGTPAQGRMTRRRRRRRMRALEADANIKVKNTRRRSSAAKGKEERRKGAKGREGQVIFSYAAIGMRKKIFLVVLPA